MTESASYLTNPLKGGINMQKQVDEEGNSQNVVRDLTVWHHVLGIVFYIFAIVMLLFVGH
jgi:hypothetical protein